jgi:hypothetical protein
MYHGSFDNDPGSYLVRSGSKVSRRHFQSRPHLTRGRVSVGTNTTSHRQGHENVLGGFLENLQHWHILNDTLPKRGDIEKGNLIRSFLVVSTRQANRFTKITNPTTPRLHALLFIFANVVLIAFGDHQVAVIVGTHIERHDNALDKLRDSRRVHRNWFGLR